MTARKPISQREARALKKRVKELETEARKMRAALGAPYAGRWIGSVDTASEWLAATVKTAMRLGFTVVARFDDMGTNRLNLHAIPTEVRPNV